MRVAISQFATSLNTQENLASCLRMINEAATCKPSLIVLPEYCNTQPWYTDKNQAWDEALTTDGEFLQAIAEQAKQHDCYIVLGITLRRDNSNVSVTSCLFSPLGELIQQVDKKTLTDHESNFFISTNNVAKVATTAVGNLGLLAGSDDMTFEASREFALSGVQLLCHSMSSFALDQSSYHGPTRACENKVFLASSNKIGPITLQEQTGKEPLTGIGQSQIVAPDGKILAKMSNDKEGFAFADINLAESNISHKLRPDGTDMIKQRRPELYLESTQPVTTKAQSDVPATANVAIFATYRSNEQAIEDVCHYIENNLSDIIQLPELFFLADKAILNDVEQLALVADLSKAVIEQVSAELRPFQYACTSLVIDGMHQAVIISEHGVFSTQQQLHFCQRYQWTTLGNELNIIELPLEQGTISLAMLTADDVNIPEIVNIAALANIHVLLVPFDIQEPCEVDYSLLARAAENRICIVAASREKSFAKSLSIDTSSTNPYGKNKVKAQKSTGLIANLSTDSTLLSQWKPLRSNGYTNRPLVKYQFGKITKAVIHPIAACTKLKARKLY
jgi:predicted amidohydrolase